MQTTIGIIGNGFVGNAVAKGFEKSSVVRIYDIDSSKSTDTLINTIRSDYIFVCLPTPMTKAEGGECNLSILKNFFVEASSIITDGIFIIKSTVPVGTVDDIVKQYPDLKIVHNPEFLTASNAEQDFVEADRHVIGGTSELTNNVKQLYENYFPNTPVYTMRAKESEAVKYFANCFLASKVMIFNEMRLLCDELTDVNYDKIIDGVASDNRIGFSHTQVPGPDGDYGFGGTCFPKDINALIHTMEDLDIDPLVLKSVWKQNKNLRKKWDWSNNESAVRSKL